MKMQDKSSKNGFETHTNTEEEENLPLEKCNKIRKKFQTLP